MDDQHRVSEHYTHGSLIDAIKSAIGVLGKSIDTLTVDDLAPVDEFHIGGRQASEDFLGQLSLSSDHHVIDVGCGLGGPARFAASRFGCQLSGIDLTDEFVEAGRVLSRWVGLDDRIALHQGSALKMPFDDAAFNAGYMLHVGMNIDDKKELFCEVHRVLQPGSMFGVYDVMQTGEGDLTFPVPWATTEATSAVATPEHYRAHLEAAGFAIVAERNRRDFALEFFDQLRAKTQAAGGPPPLGLHVLMGHDASEKLQNMIGNISAGRIAPVELIARK